jgi:hypothetical protein
MCQSGPIRGATGIQRRRLRRRGLLIPLALGLFFLGGLIGIQFLWEPEVPKGFTIMVADRSGKPLQDDGLIIFEKEWAFAWAGPCPKVGPEHRSLIGVFRYNAPIEVPTVRTLCIPFGPAIFRSVSGFYVLARGYKLRYFGVMHVDPDVTYDTEPSPTGEAWRDRYKRGTYRLTPLTTIEERKTNIQEIKDVFHLWNGGRGILRSLRDARIVRAFLKAEEEELERLLAEEKGPPESR